MPSDTAAKTESPSPDYSGFQRHALAFGRPGSSPADIVSLSTGYWQELGPLTHPHQIPWHVIDIMGFHPHMSLAEEIWAALLRNTELYRVQHDDPAIRAETEAWLATVLPQLLHAASLAFAYGVMPYVLDWDATELAFTVKRRGSAPFQETLHNHAHFVDIHELHPKDVTLKTQADRLVSLRYSGQDYQASSRAFVSVWGRTFGGWLGRGSRRKAYKAFFRAEHCELWLGRFLERNVDPPRKAHAPAGKVKINGEDVIAAELMADVVMGLKGAGVAVIPGGMETGSTSLRAWDVVAMDLKAGESSAVFNQAINLANVEMFIASLVPPTAAGIQDAAFASGRVHAELLEDLLNVASNWLALQVSAPVEVVHKVRYGSKVPPAKIVARQFPKAKAKRFLDLFKAVKDSEREIKGEDGKTRVWTPADLVRGDTLLEELGVPISSPDEVARERPAVPPSAPVGRPIDETSDRAERRKNAREPEGEDATGAEGEGIDGNERD